VSNPESLSPLPGAAAAALFAKVLFSILAEYRWYFPPNFDSAFLVGRQDRFVGVYRAAFYSHIITGPVAITLAAFLLLTGGRTGYRQLHRWSGRVLVLLILLLLVPTGLVMASQAHAGAVAGLGFAILSIVTAVSAIATGFQAWAGHWQSHRRWAKRSFLLLCSPLLLRLTSGAAIVFQLESEEFYRLNAWLSWLIPLGFLELWWCVTLSRAWETTRFARSVSYHGSNP
jgi:hypothetical protein